MNELTSSVEQLTAKHKKLKHKYKDLQHDLYLDDNDNAEEIVNKNIDETTNEDNPFQQTIAQQPINHNSIVI